MNQKIKLIPLLLFSAFATQAAEDVKVMQYLHAGPITVNKPILTDSLNVDGKPFEAKNLVKSTIPFGHALGNAAVIDADTAGLITVPTPEKGYALHLYSFYLTATATRKVRWRFPGRVHSKCSSTINRSAPLPSWLWNRTVMKW